MADFQTWSHENLARFAGESQAEIVRINNEHAKTLRMLCDLVAEYERVCDGYCVKPDRHEAYRVAKGVIGA